MQGKQRRHVEVSATTVCQVLVGMVVVVAVVCSRGGASGLIVSVFVSFLACASGLPVESGRLFLGRSGS